MDKQLQALAESQGRWSATADTLRKAYGNARVAVFGLSIAAALLAAISSQQPEGTARTALAVISAVCLAIVSFLTARLLDTRHATAWVRARAASEALKREGYKSAVRAAPYDDPATSAERLRREAQKIEADVDDLIGLQVTLGPSSQPTDVIAPEVYITERLGGQIKFYEKKATESQAAARKLRRIEFVLALATTIITALVGILPKGSFGGFDLVALTAVLTTLSGAILAHIEASRYDFTVASYRATARRLKDQRDNPPPNPEAGTPDWSAFVDRCESILQTENSGWIAKFSKVE
jgi:hypothetical protein